MKNNIIPMVGNASYNKSDVGEPHQPETRKPRSSRGPVTPYEATVSTAQFQADLERPAEWLKQHYAGTFTAFDSRRRSAKVEGVTIAPAWKGKGGFRQFLADMGEPRRHPAISLDRVNPFAKEYGPGLCRWATPKAQANNRRTNVYATHPVTEEPTTITIAAEAIGAKPDTLRRAVREGRPLPAGMVAGPEATPMKRPEDEIAIVKRWPWALSFEDHAAWEEAYKHNRRFIYDEKKREMFEFRIEFAIRETGQIYRKHQSAAEKMNIDFEDRYGDDFDPAPEENAAYEEQRILAERYADLHARAKAAWHERAEALERLPRETVYFR